LPCDSFVLESLRLIIIYFMDLDIQRPFSVAFRADKKPCRMHPPFYLFSAKCTPAMDAYVNMDKGIVEFVAISGHNSALFALHNREIR
jgi:hypothetical protein